MEVSQQKSNRVKLDLILIPVEVGRIKLFELFLMLVYNGLQLSILKTVFYLQHSQLLLLDFLLDSH